jgi:hypothetical protein
LNIYFKVEIGPKRKEPTNDLNGFEPLNICLKLEIGPIMGNRKEGLTMGEREIFPFFFFCNIFFIVQYKRKQIKEKWT